MAKYQKYAEYKDSGLEWLGDIPSHWEMIKLKWKARTTSGSTPKTSKHELYYENGNIPWIRTTDLNNGDLYETPISITAKAVNDTACSILPINSVLIAMYGGAGSIGKHSLLKFESTINQAVCGILPSKSFDADYLHRYYEFYRPFWMIGASGTRKDPNIGQDHISESSIPYFSIKEQEQIVDFLDHEIAKIDSLITKQETLIELLKEKRQVVISHAVTKGLNPHVKMKDSGVEWLGQVPEHWAVSCIKYILAKEKDAMVDGPFGSSVNTATDYVEEGIPVIRTVNITNQGFSSDNLKFMRISKFEELKRHSVKTGDVLFSKVGTIGNACIFPENMGVGILSTTGSCKISINEDLIDRDFLVFQIHCMNQELMQIANANVQPFLNMTNIKNLRISLPSLDEQQSIISLLKSKLDSFDRLIAKAESAIQLMQERRTALISSAVTGKIDVRNWQNSNSAKVELSA